MRIGVDYDETIADSITPVLNSLNEDTGSSYCKADLTVWAYHEALGLSKDFFWGYYHSVMGQVRPEDVLPQPTAQAVVPLLAEDNDLYILTARQHYFKPRLEEWADYWFPDCFSGVITCGGHERGLPKAHLMVVHGIDLLVDDSVEEVARVRTLPRAAILYDAPHNKDCAFPFRAADWHEVKRLLK